MKQKIVKDMLTNEVTIIEEDKKVEFLREVSLSEMEMLQFKLINTQFNLVKKSIENLEIQKQVFSLEQKTVVENYDSFKKDINNKYKLSFDDYNLDVDSNKLIIKNNIYSKSKI